MELKQARRELAEIGKTYNTIRGMMEYTFKDGERTLDHWASLLVDLDYEHFENVCHEYATLQRRPPDPGDRLPYEIKQEVQRRMDKDNERLRVMQLREMARRPPSGLVRLKKAT